MLVARFGVGYDTVDVAACTRNNVLLTITPSGVRRPVAVSALALLLALSHKLLTKDRLTREGRWHEKLDHMGVGLTGRTLGSDRTGKYRARDSSHCLRRSKCGMWPSIHLYLPTLPERAWRGIGEPGSAAGTIRFRLHLLRPDFGVAPPAECRALGTDEADSIFDQRRARTDRRSGGTHPRS